jgi:uncharacterized membrane-anchored protein
LPLTARPLRTSASHGPGEGWVLLIRNLPPLARERANLFGVICTKLSYRLWRQRGVFMNIRDALGPSRAVGLALLTLSLTIPAAGQAPTNQAPTSEEARRQELEAAWKAGAAVATRGPADVALIDQAVLRLPPDYWSIPKPEGMRILRALGNTIHEPSFVGLIGGTHKNDEWLAVLRYIKEGYVKDDDAKNWNADELLQNIKDGTAEANKERLARGFPEVEVVGWIEPPAYAADAHRLVWSLRLKHKGAADAGPTGVNYNTYALGRDGYFSLNLLTTSGRVAADKAVAHELLAALSYKPGKRYEDFNASTDHIAEYGLAALVGGVVAKKLGLVALVAAFVLKFAKAIGLAVAAFGAGIWKFFRRKSSDSSSIG